MKSEKGFTLINLIIIVIVMSIIAAVSVELLTVSEEDRMRELTLKRINSIMEAIYGDTDIIPQTYFGYVADIGELPTSLSDLIYDTGDPNWNGPYLFSDFDDINPQDLIEDAYGNLFEYDMETGTISTAEGSVIDIEQIFEFDPEKLTHSTLWGNITDRNGNIPLESDLENIYISLIYTIDKSETGDEEVEGPGKKVRRRPFWWKWSIEEDIDYKWNWKIYSRRWKGGGYTNWWNENKKPWWTEDGDYQPPLGIWKKWYQTTSDYDWWHSLIQEKPEQKKWSFWWWWRHRGRHKPDPSADDETVGRFITVHPNADGTYRFNDIPIGNYNVEASHDLLGVAIEKLAVILPNVDNKKDFRFNPIFPGYPGYGEDIGETEASGLKVTYSDLFIDGYSDDDIRLANADTINVITIDKIKVSWSDAQNLDRINKIEIDDKQRWSSGWGWNKGEKSGTLINISDYKIQPQETGKILELFFNKNLNPKELELVFILDDGSEVPVPPAPLGSPNPAEEADFLSVNYTDLVINGSFDEDVSIGNSSTTANVTVDKISLAWSGSKFSQRLKKIVINGETKWQSAFGKTSGNVLDITDVIVPPLAEGIGIRFEFNKNLQNKNMNIGFNMADNSTKTVP